MNIRAYSRSSLDSRIRAARAGSDEKMGACRRVHLPPGRFLLGDKALILSGARGLVLEGAGPDATELVVDKDTGVGVLFMDCIRSGLANLSVRAQAHVGAMVRFGRYVTRATQAAEGWPTATQCLMDNVVLDGGAYEKDGSQDARASYGLEFTGAVNENNDCHTLTRVHFHSYRLAGLHIVGNQSKEHRLDACRFDGNNIGRAAIWSAGGGFRAIGCGGGGHTMADVFLEDTADSITLVGCHFETSRRFIDQPNRTGVPMAITLEGCEWMADQLAQDGDAIRINGPGPLTILGGHYGSGKQPIPHFRMDPFSEEPATFTCLGATFGAFGATQAPESPFRLPTLVNDTIQGNVFADGRPERAGMAVIRPEWTSQGWMP